jgi:hypothetical protein
MAPKQRSTIDDIGLSVSAQGLFVEGTTLCLEGSSLESLSFLSSPVQPWQSGKLGGRQVLVSDDAHEILVKKFPKIAFLSCKYLHPITLGSLTLELLPSGEAPGSSFLLIRKGDRSLLYVSHWNPEAHPAIRKPVLRSANRLLIRIESGEEGRGGAHHHVRHELERLGSFARQILDDQKCFGLIVKPARDLHRVLSTLPPDVAIFADAPTLEYAAACSQSVSDLPTILRERMKNIASIDKTPPKSAAIFLISTQTNLKSRPEAIWALGTSRKTQRQTPATDTTIIERFQIAHTPSHSDILRLVSETGADEVVLVDTGEAAENCLSYLNEHRIRATLLSAPKTTPLF